MPGAAVRAVGTNTLRRARNGARFAALASEALGHPVEIISGHEEARLIYLGVVQGMADEAGRHLVIDIGGGSTECILGAGIEPGLLDSLYIGCVGYTQRFFREGKISAGRFRKAETAAALEFESISAHYRELGWSRVTGSSGTVLAIREVLRASGISEGGIARPALAELEQRLVRARKIAAIDLPGLEPDRAAVFPGGVAILRAAFEQLGIETMETSNGALREGLVFELLGGVYEGDPRDRTVETFASRYKVDAVQARRVEGTALALFEQANAGWGHDADAGRRFLRWSARLHEIGLSIAHAGHHKHGAYILEHAEMPGFSMDDQALLAAIVGAHRRKLTRRHFAELSGERQRLARDLTVLLRLAVCLHHARSADAPTELEIQATRSEVTLAVPGGWLDARPLTQANLEDETGQIAKLGVALQVRIA
jgi:exopolyphosphatase/guanosine-5'-triphosphate,3'-diphosphate pyrophosphatase